MAHPYHHALSSVKKWGGMVEDYLAIHDWFDASKAFLPDFRHRALRHHAEGIFWAEGSLRPYAYQRRRQAGARSLGRRAARQRRSGLDSHAPGLVQAPARAALDGQGRRPGRRTWRGRRGGRAPVVTPTDLSPRTARSRIARNQARHGPILAGFTPCPAAGQDSRMAEDLSCLT